MRVSRFLGCAVFVLAALTVQSCKTAGNSASTVKDGDPTAMTQPPHTIATHGMFVFGGDTVYMYHLPMWQWPHDYEIVIETTLPADVKADYDAERATGRKMFTFVPDPFYLPDLLNGQKTTLHGSLVFGHFEQDQNPKSIGDVTATVTRVVYQKTLNPQEPAPASATYEIFGKGSEWYAAHKATHQPDYDQILELSPDQGLLAVAQQANATEVMLSGQSNAIADRLQPGAVTTATTSGGTSVPFAVTGETYFNTGDLQ